MNRTALHASLVGGAVVLPLLLWRLDTALITNSYGKQHELFELFGFALTIALGIGCWRELSPILRRRDDWRSAVPLLVFGLLTMHFLVGIAEHSDPSWDYERYEAAAAALESGDNPYDGTLYLYPPLPAQLLGSVRSAITALGLAPVGQADFVVFYLYQCCQLFLVGAAFWLGLRYMRVLGVTEPAAALISGALLLFSTPLVRTLRHNQPNLWLVDLILVALIFGATRPWLAGAALALGFHIKLYPVILLLPFVALRELRVVAWFGVFAMVILLLQTGFGMDYEPWRQFVSSFGDFPSFEGFFRNSSLSGIVGNTLRLGGLPTALGPWVVGTLTLAIVAGFVARHFLRRLAHAGDGAGESARQASLVDAVALMLFVSPVVWEHHYVLVLPFILWAVAALGPTRPWLVGLGVALILLPPVFDFFPFSYHRLAGLALLVLVTGPRALRRSSTRS